MAEQLQINVRVHLKEGDIKKQLEDQLKGLKNIDVDGAVPINARLSSKSLAGIKKQLNDAIENHSKKVTIHTDVKGDKEINALTRNLRELRKLAAEPIKIHASVVGAGADKALEKAIGKGGKRSGNVEVRTRVQGVASAERQLNSLRRNARDLYQEMERIKVSKNKISPSNMTDDIAKHYKDQIAQVERSIDATKAKMVKLYQNSGMSKNQAIARVNSEMNDLMKNDGKVVKVRIDADEQGLKTAVKDAESSLKKLISLQKELARAERGARNMGLSSAERGAYQARSNFLHEQIAQQHELAKANKQFNEQAYLTAKKDIGFSRDIAIARDARQNKSRYSSSGNRNTRGFGDSYNVWSALQSAGYAIAGVISNMNEVDRAITKVTKVVPDSQKAINKWTKGIYKDASSVGKSVPEYANAVEQWATAGYNLKQSNALAKRSVMGSFVGDVDVNDMVNYMAVPLNSFKRQHLKSDDIINSMNEVSNKHAVEMVDLGQAYSKASAVVSATGTSFAQLTGMITGAQEATRAGGDVVGRSIKAISQNFAKMSSGVTATDKKRAEFFHGLGVDLKDSNGKMKSTYQVMDDLSKVWGKLSKQQKQDAALYAAGKEHSAQFTGMLNNWDTVKKATSEAEGQTGLGKEGSAYQEMEKQKKSIQFQLAALGNNWRQFLANLTGGREGIADMLGMANQFLDIGQKLTSSQGLMSATRWAAMTGGILMARRALNGLLRNFNDYLGIGQRREAFAKAFDDLNVEGGGSRGRVNRRVFARKRLNDEMNKLRGQFGLAPREYIPRKENDVYDHRHSSEENEPQLSGVGYVGGGARATKSAANAEHELESAGKKARTSQKGLGDTMKDVGGHAMMAGSSMKNAARGIGEAGANAAKGASKIGRVVSTAKTAGRVVLAGIDTAAQFAGAVGLVFDVVTVAGMALNAMGIHPVKEFTKALHPARTAANALNKSLDATASSIDKTSQSIENNGLVNGSLKQGIDGAKQLSDSLSGLNPASKLDKGALKDIKDTYNSIAKKNGLELRITGEQEVGNVLKKVKDLQEVLQNVKKDDASKLASDALKQNQNVVKALSGKNMDKLLKSNSVYNKKLDALRDSYSVTGRHTGRNAGKGASSLHKDEDALRQSFMVGPNNAALWNSKEGRKLSAMVAKAQKSTRQAIGAFGENYANGMLTKNEVSNMSVGEQKLAGLGVIKNLRDLIASGADKNGSDVAKAKNDLNDVLTASGVGKKNIEKIQNAALNGSNSSMMRALMSGGFGAGNIGAMAGITAQYQQQHGFGNKAIKAAIHDESQVEKYRGKHKNSANAEALYDPNTGFLDYGKIARFNSGAVTTKRGRSLFKSMGGKYQKDGTMSIGQALDLTKGMDGDPTKILSNIAKGKAAANTIASVANNARGGKATGAQVASAIAQSQAVSGTKMNYTQFDAALRQSNLTGEQKDAALADRKRNFTQSGNAKTLKGFAEATKGLSSLSKSEFKDLGKALSSTERKAALKDAQDKGLLTAKQAKALEKWSKGNSNGKTESSTMPGKGSDGKLNKFEKAAIKSAVGSLKGEKGKVSKNDFNKKMKDAGLKGNKDSQRKAYNDLLKAGKLSKSAQKSLAKQLGLKVPKTATKNNNSGKSRNSGNGKTSKTTKTNKTADSSKKKGTAKAGQIKANSQLGKMLAKALGFGKKTSSKPKSGSSSTKKKSSTNNKKAEKEGRDEEKARQRGRDSVKRQANAKKASESKKAIKDAQNQGKKEAQAKSKGSSSGSKGAKKSQKKVKVKADLDTKSMNSKLKSAGKKQKIKVKADVDAKNVKGKLQKAGKGAKVKVKADVDAKNVKGKLQKAGKGTKVKVKTDADTAGLKNKIKSAAKGQKAKVKVDADTSGVKGKIKAAVSGMKATVKVNVSANTGKLNALKSALAGISSKRVSVSASVKGTGKVNSLKSAINGVHSKHVTVAAKTKGLGEVKALQAAIDSVHGKSVTVSVTKSITTVTHTKKGKSVGIGSIPAGVSADVGVGAGPTQITGMGMPGSVTNYSTGGDDQTVNEDYWRYMDKQLYTGLPLDEQVNKLENAVTQADEDMDKLISVAKQRIDVDNKQIAYQKQMQAAYQQEVTDMINKLHGFGFQSNGNRITNLGHAKDIKGDNASKVDEYLGKYQTAYQNLSEATKTIQDLQTDIWQQGKNQEDYRNTKDQKMVEKLQRSLEILNTVVENHKSIMDRYAESLTEQDYVMKNKNSADQIMTKYNDVYDLMQKFNELSKANFVGTKEADNAQNLYESLQSIRDSVMENLDAIEELKKSMRDNEIAAVADNLARYTDNLNDSIDRLKNNVSNLEDGLLSGTNYTDLISSNFDVASFDQRSAYEKNVEDRIALEKQFDAALDAFAKKNVDRTAQVANQQLQINFQMYEELAKMGEDFANKTLTNIEPIRAQYEPKGMASDMDIPGITRNKEYQKTSEEYQKRMNALKDEYVEKLSRANTASEKEAINQEMVYKQLELQETVLKGQIDADQKAIATLKQMANDPSMNSEQLKNIKDQIREYTQNAIDAQNQIKDAIKERFEYEKQLIDKTMDEYQRMSDTVSNLVTIADALNLDGVTQGRLIGRQIEADMNRYEMYLNKIAQLRQQMSQYEKGSFEYNQLSEMVNGYQSDLETLITTLLDETRSQFKKTLDENMKEVQRNTYGGKTMDQAKFDQELWYSPSQKELRIEEMRLKITELEDKTIDKKISALDRQERLSKSEADYVDKQLDLALAQQKLNNALHKRDVQYITKTADGRFQNGYTYDQAQVDDARKEVNTDKQQLEDLKQTETNDFNTKFKEIIDAMTDGSINQEEARREIQDLAKSKEFVLGDIKGFDPSLLEKPIEAYNKFVETNKDILNRASGNSTIAGNNNYQEIIKGFGDQFKAVSKDLGEIFGKELKTILYRPDGSGFIGGGTTNSLTIQNMSVSLPNVRDIDEFREALNTLPQVAAQKATSK